MPLPAGVETVTVTSGEPLALPDGTLMQGRLFFTGPDLVTIGADDVVLGGTVEVILVDGEFSVTLCATDATGMSPTGWTYKVTTRLTNAPNWTRYITLPKATTPVVLADIVVPDPVASTYTVLVDGTTLLAKAQNLADLASVTTARTNLGLGGAALLGVGTADGTVASGEHVGNLPSDQGLLAWTYDPDEAGHVTAQSNAGVAGRITLTKIQIRRQITWSNIWIGLSGVDAAAVLASCFLGVYDSAGTLKGTTADISSSLMSGATAKALALTQSFVAAPGAYYVAMLLNGTWATNSLTFKCSGAGVSVNAKLTAGSLRYSNMLTGQTSLPASLTLSSQSTSIISTGWASQWYGVD